jgi:hypothetical protein
MIRLSPADVRTTHPADVRTTHPADVLTTHPQHQVSSGSTRTPRLISWRVILVRRPGDHPWRVIQASAP